ncbi:alpha-N-arabinofuranosidase [Streptohalobacillus salinus]|uniref:Alpha-N-arabinofuranosidase n=1 Tax=Streptohalobacillus salinus TaxID=621096 RepID=A0A2V3WHY1_9BACI|nr:glycoside hydrolase family 43 protein [Streptohalobacillus salinus]PXW93144.1 alpha-N-arabinofuranosidase [Streptohalobacillus salinus]
MTTYQNPVLSGFYPDPSVIRVDEDYYLVTSTFEFVPGVPIFHSKNLKDWKRIGYCISRESQLSLKDAERSAGIYAPTLRHHDGVFYMITTDVNGIGNFYVKTTDPSGEWSDPIRLPYGNIDPSLFFDDDGKVYVTAQEGEAYQSHIIQYEIDIETGKALTKPVHVFDGDGGPWLEGPHLYKIDGRYLMMCASGGTDVDHREIIGTGTNPYGPFHCYPDEILTHRDQPHHPIQALGHADLVEDHFGDWWMVCLATRPNGLNTVLGRETYLVPVTFNDDGIPMAHRVDETMKIDRPLLKVPSETAQLNDFFYLREKPKGLEISDTFIRFKQGKQALSASRPAPAAVFTRQVSRDFRFSVDVSSDFTTAMTAGITLFMNEFVHITLSLTRKDGQLMATLEKKTEMQQSIIRTQAIPDRDHIRLTVIGTKSSYQFLVDDNETEVNLGIVATESVAIEQNNHDRLIFTGMVIGLYVEGDLSAPVQFSNINHQRL